MLGLVVVTQVEFTVGEPELDAIRRTVDPAGLLEGAVSVGRAESGRVASQDRGLYPQPLRLVLVDSVVAAELGDRSVELGQPAARGGEGFLGVVARGGKRRNRRIDVERFQPGRHPVELVGRVDHAE